MTDLAAVLAGVQAVLESDASIGLAGSAPFHLKGVSPNVEWDFRSPPTAALMVRETTRTAQLDRRESVAATVEVRLALPGRPLVDGGDQPTMVALVGEVRRALIQHRLLATGDPPKALITGSRPTGETYEVLQPGERGWFQTAVLRWDANWLEPRLFGEYATVDERHVRVITINRALGVTEDAPPVAYPSGWPPQYLLDAIDATHLDVVDATYLDALETGVHTP